MNAQYQSINFTADQKLIDFIQKKLDKLEVFHDDIVRGEVFLKVSKASNKENKLVEFKVHVPGRELVAKNRHAALSKRPIGVRKPCAVC